MARDRQWRGDGELSGWPAVQEDEILRLRAQNDTGMRPQHDKVVRAKNGAGVWRRA